MDYDSHVKSPYLSHRIRLFLALLASPRQRDSLRAVVGTVGYVHCRGARPGRFRRELHAYDAVRFGRHTAAAGVGLSKIAGIGAGEGDAADGQRGREIVGERHVFGGARCAYGLGGKRQRGRVHRRLRDRGVLA